MYRSGFWKGFWQQPGWGRQPMEQFELTFATDGEVAGRGLDVVGPFIVHGSHDLSRGRIEFIKQYVGRHQVHYVGQPDGEGRIVGTWTIGSMSGPFSLQPAVDDNAPILEIIR